MRRAIFALALVLTLTLGMVIGRGSARDDAPGTLAVSNVSAATPHMQPAAHSASAAPEYLFAQDANAGTFRRVAGRPGRFRLALSGVRPSVLYFTDRPDRVVGAVSVATMLRAALGNDRAPKPNAAVNVVDRDGHQVVMGVELMSWTYHRHAHTLVYTVRKLRQGEEQTRRPGLTDRALPRRFGETSVFIDDVTANLCTARLLNNTVQNWSLQSATLDFDFNTWSDLGYPPSSITPPPPDTEPADNSGSVAAWSSVGLMVGFTEMSGCASTVVYKGDDGSTVRVDIAAPIGSSPTNTGVCTSSSSEYTCTRLGPPYSTSVPGAVNVSFVLTHV